MKVYLLEIHYWDNGGYNPSKYVGGVFRDPNSARLAGKAQVDYAEDSNCDFYITEMDLL